jgi:catechol 2,3-dioxygenase-like lactoylglutathione lyase family enzyme
MLQGAQFVGFIPVRDLAVARAFFVDTLGLTFLYQDEYALAVDANGTTVRINQVRDLRPQPFTIAGWSVNDVAATVDQMNSAGVSFKRFAGMEQDDRGIWHTPDGDLVAWFADPDDNVLSISGRATA